MRAARRTCAASLIALLSAAAADAQKEGQQPSFPASSEVVTVDAVVLDHQGVPIRGVRREEFTIAEDGVVQEVVAFEAVERRPPPTGSGNAAPLPGVSSNVGPGAEGRTFVVVLDELHLDAAEAKRSSDAVAAFVNGGVADGDRVTLVGVASNTWWTARMPEGREALLQVLRRLQGRRTGDLVRDAVSAWEAFRIDRERDPIVTDRVMRRFLASGEIRQESRLPGDAPDRGENLDGFRSLVRARAAQVYARSSAQNQQTLAILERSLLSLSTARGRKSLILVSGGLVNDTHLAGFRRVVSASRLANAALYFLDARGLAGLASSLTAEASAPTDANDRGPALSEAREGSEGAEGLAADTGGFSVRNTNDLGSGIERIGRESASYYLIGYTPSDRRRDGRFRRIEVTVAREGAVIRARRGYYAGDAVDGRRSTPENRDAAIQHALDSPFDLADVPLRAAAHVLGEAEPGKARVLVTVEADVRALAFEDSAGGARDSLETLLVVARRDTGDFYRFDQQYQMRFRPESRARYEKTWFPVTRELALVPASYQARIVARDRNSGRVGSLTCDFEVPELGLFRISTPILSDRVREAEGGGPGGPEVIARRTFAPAGLLHFRFEIFGAALDAPTGAPNVTAGFSIRRPDGRLLAVAAETPVRPGPDGSLSRTQGTPLDGAPPGLYELIVVVTDLVAGRPAEARAPFEIEALSAR